MLAAAKEAKKRAAAEPLEFSQRRAGANYSRAIISTVVRPFAGATFIGANL